MAQAASGAGFLSSFLGGAAGALNPASLGSAAATGGMSLLAGAAVGGLTQLMTQAGRNRAKRARIRQKFKQEQLLKEGAVGAEDAVKRESQVTKAAIDQNMVDRGTYSSTARDSLYGLADAEAGRSIGNIRRDLANQLAGVEGQDVYQGPDLGLLSSLSGQFTQGVTNTAFARPGVAPTDQSGNRAINPAEAPGLADIQEQLAQSGATNPASYAPAAPARGSESSSGGAAGGGLAGISAQRAAPAPRRKRTRNSLYEMSAAGV